jgi:NAD(P)-dependent dehydrogenase (short-subunit alcohol dehydrogenase family)
VLLEVVSEKTGYPAETLGLDMALDADLGVDSIKRVEILSALQERLPSAPAVKPEHLGTLHTLRQLADFLAGRPDPAPPPVAPPLPPAPALTRLVLRAVPLDARWPRPAIAPPAGAEIWVASDDAELARALESRLLGRGVRPRLLPCAGLADQPRPEALAGLILLARPDGGDDALLRNALLAARQAGPALREAGRRGGAVLAAVSRLDGAFGLAGLDPSREPLDGGLAGLAKTAAREWPEVNCKAVDLAGDFADLEQAADALLEELFLAGPAEVGLSGRGRVALEAVPQPLAVGPAAAVPLSPGDVVLVSGGGRGVTAEAALALARAFRPTLVLLGRSPPPDREPDWLAPLTSEADIKRELTGRANGSASPRRIGEQYRLLAAQREVRRTMARLEEAGAKAIYQAVDICDAAAVAELCVRLRRDWGPVRGLVHGAGVLADARLEDKTAEQFDRVYRPKVVGLRSLLGALPADELRALVLFSSTTARLGRAGQADYAMANEALNKLAQREARRRPGCRVVSVNWGPWDGGMVTPPLKKIFEREGVGLIAPAAGGDFLVRELGGSPGDVEVTALAGELPASAEPPHAVSPPPAPPPLPLAFERVIDLESCPVLRSHVLDGRPVMPLALTLEWLAHAALHHNPGLTFHGCDDLRVLHGVVLDGPSARLRVGAGKAELRDGLYRAPAELRGVRPDGREVLHVRAEVVLAADLPPAPPPALPAPRGPYPRSPRDAYREVLFHGPDLQCIEQVEGRDAWGVAGRVRAAPAPSAWLRQPLRQRWLADPLALDGAFQLMILWSFEQHGAAGLPCLVARYRQHRRSFPAGGARVVAQVTRSGDLSATADLEFLDAEGALIARMEGYECALDAGLMQAFRRNQLGPAETAEAERLS